MTDIIIILSYPQFTYHSKHGVICNSKLYYTMFKITKCTVLGNLLIKYYVAKKLLQNEP